MHQLTNIMFLFLAGVLTAGCSPEPSSPPIAQSTPKLNGLPIEMTVKQRSTTVVPGSDGAIRLTIDDITRGQVIVSLASKDGSLLLAPTSLTPNDSVTFMLSQDRYLLMLKKLNNALVGEDFGTFVVSAASTCTLSERAKIERLIALVESIQGAVFIRNGAEHTVNEAADHLLSKWKVADSKIKTAKQFVELSRRHREALAIVKIVHIHSK